jgi:tyrosine-protein kinase Etk/Wzc
VSNNVTHIADRNEDSDEINLSELFSTLLAGKWLILAMIIISSAIGYAHLWRTAPVYKADVLLQVEKKGGVAIPGMELLGLDSADLGTATEIQIIQSRKILGQVVDELKLTIIAQPNYFPVIGASYVRNNSEDLLPPPAAINWLPIDLTPYAWANEALDISHFTVSPEYENQALTLIVGDHSNYHVFNSRGTLLLEGIVGKTANDQDDNINLHISKINAQKGKTFTLIHQSRLSAIQHLRDQLKIAEVGKQSGILRLTMQGKNKQDIAKKLNKVSNIYLQLNVSRSAKEASKSLEFLQGQVKGLKAETDKADNDLQQFRTKNKTIDLTLETSDIMQRVAKIDEALQNLLLKQAELEKKIHA